MRLEVEEKLGRSLQSDYGFDKFIQPHYLGEIMLLQDKQTGNLIEILDLQTLINPNESAISARIQEGQEEQDPTQFSKTDLIFPSGENLPICWLEADYRQQV